MPKYGSSSIMNAIGCILIYMAMIPTIVNAAENVQLRDFGFGEKEIYEFKNDISKLIFYDVNLDGLDDLLFLNNRMSRIEILIREKRVHSDESSNLPSVLDAFDDFGFLLDQKTTDLKVQDLNGDDRPDIITAGTLRGVRIYLQQSNGRFKSASTPLVKNISQLVSVNISDFNHDGFADILICRKRDAEILYNDHKGRFRQGLQIDFTANECDKAINGDFNGDTLKDIIFYFPKEKLPLRLFLGQKNGGFGWEYPLEIPNSRVVKKVSLVDQKADQLLLILKNSVNVRNYELTKDAASSIYNEDVLTPMRTVVKGFSRKIPMSWTVHDFNNDGFEDYCINAPEVSRVMIYYGNEKGLHSTPEGIDSLRRIQNLGVDSRGDLYVFSPEESAIACHPKENHRDFPSFIEINGTPLVMSVTKWAPGFFCIVKHNSSRLSFITGGRNLRERRVDFNLLKDMQLDSMKVFPVAKRKWAVICFSPYEKPVMYIWDNRSLTSLGKEQLRALGMNLTEADFTPVGGIENPALIVSEGHVARLYHYDGYRFSIEKQFGLPDEKSVLRFGVETTGPLDRDGYLFYNGTGNELCWIPKNETQKPVLIPFSDEFKGLVGIIPYNKKFGKGFIMPCRSETRWVPESSQGFVMNTISGYSSPVDDPELWNLFSLKLGNPPRQMSGVLDGKNASITLLSARNKALYEELSFEIFQGARFDRRKQGMHFEPREVASGDLNGDGLMDLGILVHDKLIIHMGE